MRTTIAYVNAVTAAVLLTLGGAATAQVGPGSLQGRYGFSASGTCLGSPSGFYPNNVAIEPSSVSSNVAHGVFTFERDGKGSASIVQTQLNLPPLSSAALAAFSSSANITFNFKYELAPGGAMTVNVDLETYAATYLTGPLAGFRGTFVTTGLAETWDLSGTYSNDRKTLLLNSGNTVSLSRLSNGSLTLDTYVICQIGRVLTRLTP
ncbi:MAG: hypothetical protein H6R06_2304 [Proteobacteria bacterium]|nr:hypothetical protein [Pseudomonadota bacterium]